MPFGTDNLCVWHIPKSGGTTLRRAMVESGVDAKRIDEIHATHKSYREWPMHNYHAIIVRDPVDWYSSAWRWMRANGRRHPLARWFPTLKEKDLKDFPHFLIKHVGCYSRIIKEYAPPGSVYIRTENMIQDVSAWMNAAGVKFDKEKLKSYPIQNITDEPPPKVDSELVDLIRSTEYGTSR